MKNTIIKFAIFMPFALSIISCGGNKTDTPEQEDTTVQDTTEIEQIDYVKIGKEIAKQTKGNLGKNLFTAISNKGTDGAVEFCNTKAIPITDSMAIALSASIKRVSDKPRNLSNQANESELEYIDTWRSAQQNGQIIDPEVMEIEGKMVGYYPIITNQACMQCHGNTSEEINAATLIKINTLYPKDKATGYNINEIRGLFVVGMDKKNQK